MAQTQFLLLPKMDQNLEQKNIIQQKLLFYKQRLPCSVENVSIVTLAHNFQVSSYFEALPHDTVLEVLSFLPITDIIIAGRFAYIVFGTL